MLQSFTNNRICIALFVFVLPVSSISIIDIVNCFKKCFHHGTKISVIPDPDIYSFGSGISRLVSISCLCRDAVGRNLF